MYRLKVLRFSVILFFQVAFLLFDLLANSFSFLAKNKNSLIFLYLAQDALIILGLALLFYSIYSTVVYQAGITSILYKKFKSPVIAAVLYLILCISLHSLIVLNEQTSIYQWSKELTTIFMVQRLCKFACLSLSSMFLIIFL